MAKKSQGDDELKVLFSLRTKTLQLKHLRLPGSTTEINCDIFTGIECPYVPQSLQRNVFLTVHNLLYLEIRASTKLISKEAYPITDITAETVVATVISEYSPRFEVPGLITTDQGCQLEFHLRCELCVWLGIHKVRTTPYHPSPNRLVEQTHRSLKATLMAHATPRWTQVLPFVPLGLRPVIKEDINCFVHPEFSKCTHTLRHDALRKPLLPSYGEPYAAVKRSKKHITLQ
ncbi:integrase catalytic domain-containing protein [Trichonephila clavipes]|uniref:Integrase catalytic domain-containing protein n=1 Tax=Trichonephila clavipes TaxID=2585209 RepID=A0A8X6VJ02_TRICX|nr:integrase catalytic domain-containing protein [Trichonephila clavipes]